MRQMVKSTHPLEITCMSFLTIYPSSLDPPPRPRARARSLLTAYPRFLENPYMRGLGLLQQGIVDNPIPTFVSPTFRSSPFISPTARSIQR